MKIWTLVFALLAPAAFAQDLPALFSAKTTNAPLNAHENPDSTSPILDTISIGKILEVVFFSVDRAWGRVNTDNQNTAWVLLDDLELLPVTDQKTDLERGVVCQGEEPDWYLSTNQNGVIFDNYANDSGHGIMMQSTFSSFAQNRGRSPQVIMAEFENFSITATMHRNECWGAGIFAFSINLLTNEGGKRQFYEGCCSLDLDR